MAANRRRVHYPSRRTTYAIFINFEYQYGYTASDELPSSDDQPLDFATRHGSVGVWTVTGWDGDDRDTPESVSEHYDKRANRSDITGTVAAFSEDISLPAGTRE